jgi:hypothetical protein
MGTLLSNFHRKYDDVQFIFHTDHINLTAFFKDEITDLEGQGFCEV